MNMSDFPIFAARALSGSELATRTAHPWKLHAETQPCTTPHENTARCMPFTKLITRWQSLLGSPPSRPCAFGSCGVVGWEHGKHEWYGCKEDVNAHASSSPLLRSKWTAPGSLHLRIGVP